MTLQRRGSLAAMPVTISRCRESEAGRRSPSDSLSEQGMALRAVGSKETITGISFSCARDLLVSIGPAKR